MRYRVGFLCYNLSSGTTGILNKITKIKSPFYQIKAYPLQGDKKGAKEKALFPFRSPYKNIRHVSFNNFKGTAPEVQVVSPCISLVRDIVEESDIICLLGIQSVPALLTALTAYVRKKPVIGVTQTMNPIAEKKRPLAIRLLKSLIYKLCTYIVAQTEPTKETLTINYHIPEEKIFFIPWDGGMSEFMQVLGRFSYKDRIETRKRLSLDDHSIAILFVGTLYHLKGVDVLIRALKKVTSSFPKNELLVVGPDGGSLSVMPNLRMLVNLLELDSKVRFIGPLPWNELAKVYLASDMFVLPTRKDIWPKVLLEAALAGLPLITTEICGCAGYIVKNGVNGYIVPVDDISSLSEAIIRLNDQMLRVRFGKESMQIAEQYIGQDFEGELYNEVILNCIKNKEVLLGGGKRAI